MKTLHGVFDLRRRSAINAPLPRARYDEFFPRIVKKSSVLGDETYKG